MLALFFSRTRIGRALRAVADDHQAALAVGIPLQQIWAIVWAVAGFVALVAGLLWGARNGVQFALTFVALKALPVLILGGFDSVPGAIVGGLIIGSTEKLAEVYLGPYVGGGIEGWFPYVLALIFLLVRPEGLFGERSFAGSDEAPHALSRSRTVQEHLRRRLGDPADPSGSYRSRASLIVAFVVVPLTASPYLFSALLIPCLILSLAALGLNLLTGYAGQLSLGTAAFMAVGAFMSYNFILRIPGIPLLLAFAGGGITAAAVGILFGLPSLRIRGFYLAVATLAAQFFILWCLTKWAGSPTTIRRA
jgi:ABC-type branched-subunit amino acid transport system permease subunit